jgi:predicted nuclease of predicted toxin-antitoxin system
MSLLFDQNISIQVKKNIQEYFPTCVHVKEIGLINALDIEIWNYAKSKNLIIVTKDSDFNDFYSLFGFPPKLIWLRIGNSNNKKISDLLINQKNTLLEFKENALFGKFEIIE